MRNDIAACLENYDLMNTLVLFAFLYPLWDMLEYSVRAPVADSYQYYIEDGEVSDERSTALLYHRKRKVRTGTKVIARAILYSQEGEKQTQRPLPLATARTRANATCITHTHHSTALSYYTVCLRSVSNMTGMTVLANEGRAAVKASRYSTRPVAGAVTRTPNLGRISMPTSVNSKNGQCRTYRAQRHHLGTVMYVALHGWLQIAGFLIS
jgi:hypothetical protein